MYEGNSTFNNAWSNGNNGKSFYGQGYTSAFQYLAHNQGTRDREAADAALASKRTSAIGTV